MGELHVRGTSAMARPSTPEERVQRLEHVVRELEARVSVVERGPQEQGRGVAVVVASRALSEELEASIEEAVEVLDYVARAGDAPRVGLSRRRLAGVLGLWRSMRGRPFCA